MAEPITTEADLSMLMHERRPDWLQRRIDGNYSSLPKRSATYRYKGVHSDYAFGRGALPFDISKTHASMVVAELERERGRALSILDIGAANGAFVARRLMEGHDAQGISGTDYRGGAQSVPGEKLLTDKRYLVGEAHDLDAIEGLNPEFDLIVSRFTLRHLADPLSVVEQALRRLRPGGVLMTDLIMVNGGVYRDIEYTEILGLIEGQGVDVGSSFNDDNTTLLPGIGCLIARAPMEPLDVRLPIDYTP